MIAQSAVADADARRTPDTRDPTLLLAQLIRGQRAVGQQQREVGGERDQEPLFLLAELADIPTLDHENADDLACVHQGYSAKSVEAFLLGLGDVVKCGV